jgi:hypothetical protein
MQATQASASSLNTDLACVNSSFSIASSSEDENFMSAEETSFGKNEPSTVAEIKQSISEAVQSDNAGFKVNLD